MAMRQFSCEGTENEMPASRTNSCARFGVALTIPSSEGAKGQLKLVLPEGWGVTLLVPTVK